jgi:hypothetical protein
MGGITGLALPNLSRLYDSITLSVERDAILDQIVNLGVLAIQNKQAYSLGLGDLDNTKTFDSIDSALQPSLAGYTPYILDMPPKWSILLNDPLLVNANGVCLGGTVDLFFEGQPKFHAELKAPFCHVKK